MQQLLLSRGRGNLPRDFASSGRNLPRRDRLSVSLHSLAESSQALLTTPARPWLSRRRLGLGRKVPCFRWTLVVFFEWLQRENSVFEWRDS